MNDPPPSHPPADWVDFERTKRSVLERVLGTKLEPPRLDRFIVLRTLGEGAMGRVYLVYDPELDRKVALKLIRPDPWADEAHAERRRARLLREARAIAKLAHPNVVTVHEMGTLVVEPTPESGTQEVFVLMEYVEGSTLRRWCERHKPGWKEILDAYLQAGEGLAAAHAAGIVHRDFKPDNALRGQDGRVRVADFGLAVGATESRDFGDGDPDRDAWATATNAIVGTPAYMAPEQFAGGEVDPRSDQFSFCASLFEALFGRRPFSGAQVDEIVAAIERGELSDVRTSEVPLRIRNALARGLRFDPKERFESVDQLLAELRFDPVPRRRRFAILGFGALGAAALGSLLTVARTGSSCPPPRERLEGIWDGHIQGEAEAAFLDTKLGFARSSWERVRVGLDDHTQAWLEVSVKSCNAGRADPSELTLLRTRCLDRSLRRVAALTQELRSADAEVVERSVQVLDQLADPAICLDTDRLTEPVAPPDAEDEATVEAVRGVLTETEIRARAGRHEVALETAREQVSRAESTGYGPLIAEAKVTLGQIESIAGDHQAAEQSLTEAYWQARRSGHEGVQLEAGSALVYVVGYSLARYDEGQSWAIGAMADWERIAGTPSQHATIDSNLGAALNLAGHNDEALEHHQAALSVREAAGGHPLEAAVSHNNLGLVLLDTGDVASAREHIERGLRLNQEQLGPLHPSVANSLHNLSRVAQAERDDTEAREHLEAALDIWRRAYGKRDARYAHALNTLGAFDSAIGEYATARPRFEEALPILRERVGPQHTSVGTVLYNLAFVDHVSGRLEDANKAYAQALEIFETRFGRDQPLLTGILAHHGTALLEAAETEPARPLIERAVAFCEAGRATPSDCAQTSFAAAMLAFGDGDKDRAMRLAREAYEAYAPLGDPGARARIAAWAAEMLGEGWAP